jgi:hypothetical protein
MKAQALLVTSDGSADSPPGWQGRSWADDPTVVAKRRKAPVRVDGDTAEGMALSSASLSRCATLIHHLSELHRRHVGAAN